MTNVLKRIPDVHRITILNIFKGNYMKLKLLVITITLVFSSGYTDIGIGVKGGLSLYKAHDDRSLNLYNEYRPAPEISIFCELMANKILFHNIMLTYYQAGGKNTIQEMDMYGTLTGVELWNVEKLDYTGIGYGLGLKVKLLNIQPYLSAGVSLDYLINTKEEMSSKKSVLETHVFDDSKFRKVTIRPFISGGIEYKISTISLLAEYTFSYDVLPYYVQEKTETNGGVKYSTFGHFITMGCKITV